MPPCLCRAPAIFHAPFCKTSAVAVASAQPRGALALFAVPQESSAPKGALVAVSPVRGAGSPWAGRAEGTAATASCHEGIVACGAETSPLLGAGARARLRGGRDAPLLREQRTAARERRAPQRGRCCGSSFRAELGGCRPLVQSRSCGKARIDHVLKRMKKIPCDARLGRIALEQALLRNRKCHEIKKAKRSYLPPELPPCTEEACPPEASIHDVPAGRYPLAAIAAAAAAAEVAAATANAHKQPTCRYVGDLLVTKGRYRAQSLGCLGEALQEMSMARVLHGWPEVRPVGIPKTRRSRLGFRPPFLPPAPQPKPVPTETGHLPNPSRARPSPGQLPACRTSCRP